jgi:hypothetical protein
MTPEVPARAGVVSALSGDLPCLRCKYNLRGLSVLGACPECGTPVRATLLSVVDPLASELRPVRWRRTVAWGLVLWRGGALATAAFLWSARALDALEVLLEQRLSAMWAVHAAVVAMILSGIGALVLIRPHAGLPVRNSVWGAIGVLAYTPMVWSECHLISSGYASGGQYLRTLEIAPWHATLRLVFECSLVVALLGLRPNARMLAARSLLMREGRVDRQTMLAMVAAVGVGIAADLLRLNMRSFPFSWAPVVSLVGTLLIAVSSLLLTVGLVGVFVDAWRIRDVILDPPPTLLELIARNGAGA